MLPPSSIILITPLAPIGTSPAPASGNSPDVIRAGQRQRRGTHAQRPQLSQRPPYTPEYNTSRTEHGERPPDLRDNRGPGGLFSGLQNDLGATRRGGKSTIAGFEHGQMVPVPNNLEAMRAVPVGDQSPRTGG
jgi:hypothetical protein